MTVAVDDLAGAAEEAHDGQGGDGLAGAGLADEAHDLAFADGEVDAVDGLDDAVFGEEVRFQVPHLDQSGCFSCLNAGPARRQGRG